MDARSGLVMVLVALFAAPVGRGQETPVAPEVLARVTPSVVQVAALNGTKQMCFSGFVWHREGDKALVVTAVGSNTGPHLPLLDWRVILYPGTDVETYVNARLHLYASSSSGLLALQVEEENLPAAIPVSSEQGTAGDHVVGLGFPFEAEDENDRQKPVSIFPGIISAVREHEKVGLIQLDTEFPERVGGGPLLNARGELIGILWRGLQQTGLGTAFPAPLLAELNRLSLDIMAGHVQADANQDLTVLTLDVCVCDGKRQIEKLAVRMGKVPAEFWENEEAAAARERLTGEVKTYPVELDRPLIKAKLEFKSSEFHGDFAVQLEGLTRDRRSVFSPPCRMEFPKVKKRDPRSEVRVVREEIGVCRIEGEKPLIGGCTLEPLTSVAGAQISDLKKLSWGDWLWTSDGRSMIVYRPKKPPPDGKTLVARLAFPSLKEEARVLVDIALEEMYVPDDRLVLHGEEAIVVLDADSLNHRSSVYVEGLLRTYPVPGTSRILALAYPAYGKPRTPRPWSFEHYGATHLCSVDPARPDDTQVFAAIDLKMERDDLNDKRSSGRFRSLFVTADGSHALTNVMRKHSATAGELQFNDLHIKIINEDEDWAVDSFPLQNGKLAPRACGRRSGMRVDQLRAVPGTDSVLWKHSKGTVDLLSAETLQTRKQLGSFGNLARVAASGGLVYVASEEHCMQVFDLSDLTKMREYHLFSNTTGDSPSCFLKPRPRHQAAMLYVYEPYGNMWYFDLAPSVPAQASPGDSGEPPNRVPDASGGSLRGKPIQVGGRLISIIDTPAQFLHPGMCWSRSHDAVFLLQGMGVIRRLSVPEFREEAQIDIRRDTARLTVSQGGLLAYAGKNESGALLLLHPETLKPLREPFPMEGLSHCAASPYNPVAIVSTKDRQYRLVDTVNWRLGKAYPGSWPGLRFSADGKRMFAASRGRLASCRIEEDRIEVDSLSCPLGGLSTGLQVSFDNRYVGVQARGYLGELDGGPTEDQLDGRNPGMTWVVFRQDFLGYPILAFRTWGSDGVMFDVARRRFLTRSLRAIGPRGQAVKYEPSYHQVDEELGRLRQILLHPSGAVLRLGEKKLAWIELRTGAFALTGDVD